MENQALGERSRIVRRSVDYLVPVNRNGRICGGLFARLVCDSSRLASEAGQANHHHEDHVYSSRGILLQGRKHSAVQSSERWGSRRSHGNYHKQLEINVLPA